jgi:hypothetical protein
MLKLMIFTEKFETDDMKINAIALDFILDDLNGIKKLKSDRYIKDLCK